MTPLHLIAAELLTDCPVDPAEVDVFDEGVTAPAPEVARFLRRPHRRRALAAALGRERITVSARAQPRHPHTAGAACDRCQAISGPRTGDWTTRPYDSCYACGATGATGPVWQDRLPDRDNAGRLCTTCIEDGIVLHDRKPVARIAFEREHDLQNWMFGDLARDFHVQREVRGVLPDGGGVAVDAVIQPKDPTGWTDTAPALAVEAKALIGRPTGLKDPVKWLAQMVDYTWADFEGFGRLPVLAAPGPVLTGDRDHQPTRHLLGRLWVGELVPFVNDGWTVLMQDHRVWSEAKGPRKTWSVKPRAGSR
ncbi:hypothetical protein DVS28_b0033 (plasmid) [Euzebya pacifica]|uniref:Uncharacterized protein n=1 Tax=Euzebya pacifica TaxID=1608957 RepID=A0A346Y5Q6_9ACTN|nr:hypothetical protein [Euzebya pacifica]AXV09803.1 hypothetical protein DVS28_b0033 [Euzebya pacifica]